MTIISIFKIYFLTSRHIQFIVRAELVEVHQTQDLSTSSG